VKFVSVSERLALMFVTRLQILASGDGIQGPSGTLCETCQQPMNSQSTMINVGSMSNTSSSTVPIRRLLHGDIPMDLSADLTMATSGNLDGPQSDGVFPTPLDEVAHAAIVSFNSFDILNPPRPLHFGEFTSRQVSPARVKELTRSFRTGPFHPFNPESRIAILMDPEDIEPSCINHDMGVGPGDLPLMLSDIGKTRKAFIVCGGEHRLTAVGRVMLILDKKLQRLHSRLTLLRTQKILVLIDDTDSDDDDGIVSDYEPFGDGEVDLRAGEISLTTRKIQEIEEQKVKFKTWGVVIYDISTHRFPLCISHSLTS
jgi:hypothetical protein